MGPREQERKRLTIDTLGLSVWQRYCPHDAWRDTVLRRMEAYLDEPGTQELFDQHEVSEDYPQAVLDHLQTLGLTKILVPRESGADEPERFTAYHMCALNAMSSRRDTSVAVTLSVNFLGLLPAYFAADDQQLAAISKVVAGGNFSCLLLSELPHGSNILRNDARAERGRLNRDGEFEPVPEDQACTHYRLSGEKHLINGATQHGLMFVCLRTRNFDVYDRQAEVVEPMKARGDFTMFWLERGEGMYPVPRYRTLPARAADISGLRFDNCIVDAGRVLGREHGGLAVVHKTLLASRGGVAALAAGCLNRACDLAVTYAHRRNVYGNSIVNLGGITDHLMRLEALNMLVAAISLKATSFLNSVGLGASHYTSVAKIMACQLAEEGVREGQRILGARALLRELPYERVIRDITLFGIFDGTSHVMLEELSARLAQEARPFADRPAGGATLDEIRNCYLTRPQSVTVTLRTYRRPLLLPMVEHLRALDDLGGQLCLGPLTSAAESLFALVEMLQESGTWKEDQGTRLAAAELFATLEVLIACVELCDPERRAALGMQPPEEFEEARDRPRYEFAIAWIGARVVSSLRGLLLQAGVPQDRQPEHLQRLEAAERSLLAGQAETRRLCRQVLLRGEAKAPQQS